MKNSQLSKLKSCMMLFVAAGVMTSCSLDNETADLSEGDLQTEEILQNSDMLTSNMRIAPTVSCVEGCIEEGSEIYYPVSDMATGSVGKNTKSVSYSAYNTETDFVVEVTYAITAGPANAKATITIDIDGNIMEYTNVSSGSTVIHTVPLVQDWAGCDEVAFSVLQKGLGTPITFSESYDLIPVCPLEIGDAYQGGIIAYILQDGDPGYVQNETHGIIAAPSDQGYGIVWGFWTGSFTATGATGTALGTGQANTTAIVASQGAGIYAASICTAYSVTEGATTYNDWFLPSKDELNKLYLNREAIGGFANILYSHYWSSTETSSSGAGYQNFFAGWQAQITKDDFRLYIRAVRAF